MTTPEPGLRETKKRATRDALSMATLELAMEHGLENVRTEDIVTRAGVSPRTFRNYFANKYEAIVSRHLDRTRRTADALRARPPGEPILQAAVKASLETFEESGMLHMKRSPTAMKRLRNVLNDQALQAEMAKAALAADNDLTLAIAERTGIDPRKDPYPRLVASLLGTAEHVAIDMWLNAKPPIPLLDLLESGLGQLAAGLPDPTTR